MTDQLNIAVDAMGGDNGPSVVVNGIVRFFRDCDSSVTGGVTVTLVGDRDTLSRLLSRSGGAKLPISIQHASQVITMDDHPAEALKNKPDSSMVVMAGLQKKGLAQAMVSPGNTGAMMAASLFALGRIEGIPRPAIAGTFPTQNNPTVILDVGANVGCNEKQLFQFAIMGNAYSRSVFEIPDPRVMVLNVGRERTKGPAIMQNLYQMLEDSSLNFLGNIEGDGILKGEADVVICDGFTGNILLKTFESIADLVGGSLYLEMKRHWASRAGYLLMRHSFSKLWERLDSAEYGGAPLLGLNGVAIVAHGSSTAKAIKNAVVAACDFHRSGVSDKIRQEIQSSTT
mgnify:FL=1